MGLEESNIWLICGDAFEQIKLIPSKSIDLIITDPHYDNTAYMQGLSHEQKHFLAKEFKRVHQKIGLLSCSIINLIKHEKGFSSLTSKVTSFMLLGSRV